MSSLSSPAAVRSGHDRSGARPRVPVISVGNLALGGRGKTPTVACVARLLVDAGERPSILSRGYKRRRPDEGVVIVSDGAHVMADVDRAGDEPMMLARQVPEAAVLVCDVRAEAAALAETAFDVTVHVLDDGFQHRSLERDIDLVIVTAGDLQGRRLPFGRLRSSPRALASASAVLADGDVSAMSAAIDALAGARMPRFALERRLDAPWAIDARGGVPDAGTAVVAVAGIAAPDRFARAVESAGWQVARLIAFPDHHPFTPRDAARIAAAVVDTGAAGVLTTEKDAMRLLPLRPLPIPMAVLPLTVSIEPAAAFRSWLLAGLREVRG